MPTALEVEGFVKRWFTTTTLAVVLTIVSAVGIYAAWNAHSNLQLAKAELAASKSLYSLVEKEKHRLDSLATYYKKSIIMMDTVIARKDRDIVKRDKEISLLRGSLAHALIDVQALRADSSYAYINRRIPATSELKYPFDSTQVKTIHYTFVERDGLFNINNNLYGLVDNLKQSSLNKDEQINNLRTLNGVYLSENEICKKENGSYKTEIVGLNKNVKQQKRLKTASNMAVVGAVGYIVISLLVK